MKNQHFAPSMQPLWSLPGAIRDPHGAFLAPKQPSKSTCSQNISATKRKKYELKLKMHNKHEMSSNKQANPAPSVSQIIKFREQQINNQAPSLTEPANIY